MTKITIQTMPTGFTVSVRSSGKNGEFQEAIAALKAYIAAVDRTYIPDDKVWFVDAAATEELHNWCEYLCANLNAKINWTEQRSTNGADNRRTVTLTIAEAYNCLYLIPGAPFDVVKASFRTLAKMNHPDVGGDTAMMQRINSAYEMIERQLTA